MSGAKEKETKSNAPGDAEVDSKYDVALGKRPASYGESPSTKRLKLFAVFRMFSAVVNDIGKSMKSTSLKNLIHSLSLLMISSSNPKIPLFTLEFIKSLSSCTTPSMLLNRLSFQWSWIDYSVLEDLVKASHCKDAVRLLEEFKSRLGQAQFLSTFTVPLPCPKMLPINKELHTILVLTIDRKLFECTLNYISEVKSKFSTYCAITRHSLQLIAVKQSSVTSTTFFWMISKQIVPTICSKVQANCSELRSTGILEVLVYPGVVMATDGEVRLGPLAFLTITGGAVSKIDIQRVKPPLII